MRWYLFKNETVYGPYVEEQLCAFLKHDDLVAREGTQQWLKAGDDALLKDALSGSLQPTMEWFVAPAHRPRSGPLTRAALEAMIKRGDLGPMDLIRHESWTADVALGQTKLYHAIRNPYVKVEDIPAEELTRAPRPTAASGAPLTVSDKILAALPKIEFDFEFTPRVKAMAVALTLLPVIAYGAYSSFAGRANISRAAREGWSIPSLVAGGREVKMIIALPPQPAEIIVAAEDAAHREFRKSVSLDASKPGASSCEVSVVFDQMERGDNIVHVRILYQNEPIAERVFTVTPIQKLERKKPQ